MLPDDLVLEQIGNGEDSGNNHYSIQEDTVDDDNDEVDEENGDNDFTGDSGTLHIKHINPYIIIHIF